MAKQNWQEVEFAQALGMKTNVENPGRKYAQLLLNVQSHVQPGKLVLRPGYALKYPAPSDSTITNGSFLTFEMWMDKQAVPSGQEITCLIQKGTINAISGSSISKTQNALCFWIRPYWNGSAWIDDWQWLNKIIITKVTTGADVTIANNMIKVFGDDAQGLGTGNLVGWTIYNKTKNQWAKIITSIKEDTNVTRICHTLYNSLWSTNDVVIIMRNYYDLNSYDDLNGNGIYYCNWTDIVFHKIDNDLRVGFGGQANRTGISIGYRQKYLLLNNFTFNVNYPDLTSAALQAFATTNQVCLDEFIANNISYGIDLTPVTGDLTAQTYYYKLTVMLDDYEEQLVADKFIKLDDSSHGVQINPFIFLGRNNSRITSLCVYRSTDNITFLKVNEYTVSSNAFTSPVWQINNNSELYLNFTLTVNSNPELYINADAVNIANEVNSPGTWEVIFDHYSSAGILSIVSPGANSSDYALQYTHGGLIGFSGVRNAITGLRQGGKYVIEIYLKSNLASKDVYISLQCQDLGPGFPGVEVTQTITITNSFVQYTLNFDTSPLLGTPYYLVIEYLQTSIDLSDTVIFDLISIKANEVIVDSTSLTPGLEISDEIGYTPTYDLVKGWDQAIIFRGRTYFLNPFVDQRYDGFIYVSFINSANSFMWDIASADNFRELDVFESSEVVGMILLPTMELLILLNNSITAIDPDTGVARNPIYDIGCISRNSIVNVNGIIFWCDDEDIYMLNINNGLNPTPLLEETIRDLYLAITDKNLLFCVRDKYNTYRVRVSDSDNRTEYLLGKNGWIQEQKYDYPEIYRISINKRLDFLSQGNIYEIEAEVESESSGGIGTDSGTQAGVGL